MQTKEAEKTADKEEIGKSKEKDPLSEVARRIVGFGLATPSILFLESFKPFGFLFGQALRFFQPFLSFVFPERELNELAKALEEKQGLEKLIQEIEELSSEEERMSEQK